jgi:hypothetical protein
LPDGKQGKIFADQEGRKMAEYEFTDADNLRIKNLRQRVLHVAILFMALGILQLVSAFLLTDQTERWISLGAALLLLILGWLYVRPLDNFRRITETQGQDIRQVIIAMKDLRAAYLAAEVIFGIFVAGIIVEIMRLYSGLS